MKEAQKTASFGIRLDAATLARLDAYAEQIGHKRGGAAARAIAAGLDALEGLPVAVRAAPPVRDAKGYAAILARLDALEAAELRRDKLEAADLLRLEEELAALERAAFELEAAELKVKAAELELEADEHRGSPDELATLRAVRNKELRRDKLEEVEFFVARRGDELEEVELKRADLLELLQAEEFEGTVLEAVERRSSGRLTEADVGRWVACPARPSLKAHKLARLGGGGVGEYACGLSFELGSAALAADSHTRCAGCAK